MADVDITKIERPDELIQLAWNSGLDRKAIIREGVDAARLLLAERNAFITLFWPVPRPLEAVDRWSDNPHANPPVAESLRPFASAVVPGCVLGSVIAYLFLGFHISENADLLVLEGLIIASFAVLGVVFKLLIAAALRRQVSRLDEHIALGIVLEQLRRGMTVKPALVPRACVWIHRGLARLEDKHGSPS